MTRSVRPAPQRPFCGRGRPAVRIRRPPRPRSSSVGCSTARKGRDLPKSSRSWRSDSSSRLFATVKDSRSGSPSSPGRWKVTRSSGAPESGAVPLRVTPPSRACQLWPSTSRSRTTSGAGLGASSRGRTGSGLVGGAISRTGMGARRPPSSSEGAGSSWSRSVAMKSSPCPVRFNSPQKEYRKRPVPSKASGDLRVVPPARPARSLPIHAPAPASPPGASGEPAVARPTRPGPRWTAASSPP
jgi:hypothetical protein